MAGTDPIFVQVDFGEYSTVTGYDGKYSIVLPIGTYKLEVYESEGDIGTHPEHSWTDRTVSIIFSKESIVISENQIFILDITLPQRATP